MTKKIIFCFLSVLMATLPGFAKHCHKHKHKHKHCSSKSECECEYKITFKDIKNHGTTIVEPGYYCVCEDIMYSPDINGNPVIRISASNVTLDLKGKVLSQTSKTVLGVDGIVVDPGLTNIIIKNGTVRDFSDSGIRVGAILTTTQEPVTELSISDIRSFNNGNLSTIADNGFNGDSFGGVVILNAQDVKIANCDLNENIMSGLWALNIIKLTVDNCHCDDNLGAHLASLNALTVYGAALIGVSADIAFTKCTFNRNSAGGTAAGFNSGFAFAGPTSTTNILFESCQFNDNNATVSDPVIAAFINSIGGTFADGIEMQSATNVTFNNCEASGMSLTINTPITTTFPPTSTPSLVVQAFNIQRCTNVGMTNCTSSGNKFQNNAGVGVRAFTESYEFLGVNSLYLSNCHAAGNSNNYNTASAPTPSNPSLFVVEGFNFSRGSAVVENCTSSGHNQAATIPPGGTLFSFIAGFNTHFYNCQFGLCGSTVFRECTASGNVDTGTSNGLAFGFCTREPQFAGTSTSPPAGPIVFDSCIAESNTNSSGTGTGFDIFNVVDSKIVNCFAESNNIGINVTDFGAGASTDNLFTDNIISANTNFGIQDLSAAKSNAYYGNQAKKNGPTPASTNYSGVGIFPTTASCPISCVTANLAPVLFWSLPNAPCPVDSNCIEVNGLDNVSIVN